jgi:hypothetical protein
MTPRVSVSLFVLTLLLPVIGCGGRSSNGSAGTFGSTAGAAGAAGSISAAGTNGAAGTSAAAGTAGAAGSAGDLCPSELPTNAAPCTSEGAVCTYGNDLRGGPCRPQAKCVASRWRVSEPNQSTCPPLNDVGACPADLTASCNINSVCTKNDGNDCRCTSCPPSEPVCGQAVFWYCPAPVTTAGCPPTPPNFGTTCTTEGVECAYFYFECGAPDKVCSHGVWTPGQIVGCPA